MQKISYKDSSSTPLQRLFVELCTEQCDSKSLDSYRAKVSGPTYILNEFYKLIQDQTESKLKSPITLLACRDEAVSVLNQDNPWSFGRIKKELYIKLIGELTADPKNLAQKLPLIEYETYYLLSINNEFAQACIEEIDTLINDGALVFEATKAKRLEVLTKSLITELLTLGFSKGYLNKFIKAILIGQSTPEFKERFKIFSHTVTSRKDEAWTVIFKLYFTHGKNKDLEAVTVLVDELNETSLPIISHLKAIKKTEGVNKFLQTAPNVKYFIANVSALDQYQAVKRARTAVSNFLDILHLGFSELKLNTKDSLLVINNENPAGARLQPIHYQIDGPLRSNYSLFEDVSKKIASVQASKLVSDESIAKILAATRYLRAGSEAVELEQKFVNYWIGLENIFSDYRVESSTFHNIKKYFIYSHLSAYTKRNFIDFHKSLRIMHVSDSLPDYDDNLLYLEDPKTYTTVISLANDYPLLALRAIKFQESYFVSSKARLAALEAHAKNVEWHLVRMYRIRNELVHSAAAFQNIETVTSNLRYYLVFILNKVIDFFCGCKAKPISSKKLEMRDFFYYHQSIWESMKEDGADLSKLLKMPHPIDFLR